MKYTFPTDTYGQDVVLMQIDVALLPLIVGNIRHLTREHIWIDTNSWRSGYNAIAEMLLMQNGIVEAINRLYRLTDSVYNGTVYTEQLDGSIAPALPAVPETPAGVSAGLRQQLLDAQGILPSGWPLGIGDKPATLADLVRALRNDSPAQVDRTKAALTALQVAAQGATIFDVVRGFIEDGADVAAEGGILIATLIGIMSNAAFMGLQAGQIDDLLAKMDRLIASLDGGAATRPDGNVLEELKSIDVMLS